MCCTFVIFVSFVDSFFFYRAFAIFND
jgi:hypothetical protein